MKYHNSLYKHKSISLYLVCTIPTGLVVTLVKCIVFIKEICVSLTLSARCVYCIYLTCFTDGPTGVWCVCM